MRKLLRKLFSGNIFLYLLWFQLVRKRKGLKVSFFHKGTDVYIDGYPRSGNTFIMHLIKRLLPELDAVHHLHTVAPIKIALLMKLPIFILVRDPMECIPSKYLMHFSMREMEVNTSIDNNILDFFIEDYLNYYEFVLKKKNRVSILNFDELINSPNVIMEKIQDQLKIEKGISSEAYLQAKMSYRGPKSTRGTIGGFLPNAEKEKYKPVIKNHIAESSKYHELLKLYKSIIKIHN